MRALIEEARPRMLAGSRLRRRKIGAAPDSRVGSAGKLVLAISAGHGMVWIAGLCS